MTERKKEYITDALGELEDDFIEEAITYKKPKFVWKYNRELMAAAACVAMLFLSISAYRLMPLGGMGKAGDNAAAAEQAVITEDIEAKQEGASAESIVSGSVSNSIDAKEESCVTWYSAEELFAMNRDIFLGTVTDKQVYHVTGGMDTYFTVVTVEIEDSIRGDMSGGQRCRIYLPVARIGEIMITDSLSENLEKLEIGSRAIFMPDKATEDAGVGNGEAWLGYSDFADYYFGEGMRFLFLETENGVSFETGVYNIPGGTDITLEKAAEYIRDMISE